MNLSSLTAKEPDNWSDSSNLNSKGIFLFMGEVDDDICQDAIEFLMEESLSGKHEELTIMINSPGGSMTSGFAVVDVMAGCKIPVKTIGLGVIASMGLDIFIAGKKGERTLTPNTLVMSHQYSWGQYGKEHELMSGIKSFNLMTQMAIRHYKKHTKMTEKQIRKYLLPAHDVWLSAKEALELGLCDIIKNL